MPRVLGNMAGAVIAIKHGLKGPNHSVTTACSTGLHAIGDGYNFIRNNFADVMVTGGTDACITPLAIAGFSRARALSTKFKDSPSSASRPFDSGRDGFVMSEGAGVLVLEELEHAVKRGANIICEVVGYGASCDADHITAGLPDGSGALRAMLGALSNVISLNGFQDEIWLINTHATSTPRGDLAETNAVKKAIAMISSSLENWDLKLPKNGKGPFITAHKSNLGHMMSAAGSVESAISCLSLKTGKIPGTINLTDFDKELPEGLNIVTKSIDESNSVDSSRRRLVIKNSFGFGGTNASIVFGEYKHH